MGGARLGVLSGALLGAGLLASPTPAQDLIWRELGTSATLPGGLSQSSEISTYPYVAFDSQDRPWVAYGENPAWLGRVREMRVQRWTGSEWEFDNHPNLAIGGSFVASGYELRINQDDEPFLAWLQVRAEERRAISGDVSFRILRDEEWQRIPFPMPENFGGVMELAVYGYHPFVFLRWNHNPNHGMQLFWNRGSGWIDLGPAGGSGFIPLTHEIETHAVVSGITVPLTVGVVVEERESSIRTLNVLTYFNDEWIALGPPIGSGLGINDSAAVPLRIAMTHDVHGRIVICWSEAIDLEWSLHLRVWDGADWLPIGATDPTSGAISLPVSPEILNIPRSLDVGEENMIFLRVEQLIPRTDPPGLDERDLLYRWDGEIWGEEQFVSENGRAAELARPPDGAAITMDSKGLPVAGWTHSGEVFLLTAGPGLYLDGDVNVDGQVDAADLVAAVNALMSGEPLARISEINLDLDGDEAITQADVDLLLGLLLGGGG